MKSSGLNRFFKRAEDTIGGIMFFLMIFFTGINVFIVFFTSHRRIAGLDEIVLSAYVWVTYIALGRHYKEGDCISVDFVLRILPEKARRVIIILRDIACVVIGVIMFIHAVDLTRNSFTKYTSLLRIPLGYIDLAVVIGYGSLLIYIFSMYISRRKYDPEADKEAELERLSGEFEKEAAGKLEEKREGKS